MDEQDKELKQRRDYKQVPIRRKSQGTIKRPSRGIYLAA